jgi:hypothetical protein
MNANQIDVIRRVNGGDTVLGENSTIWDTNLPMGAYRAIMMGRLALINGYELLQRNTLPGLTDNKDYCCLFMGGKGNVLVSQMRVYYGMGATPDIVMLERIGFSFTELTTGSPELILERNTFVSTTFNSIVAAMITAGLPVTTLMGTAYSTAIVSYNSASPGYRDGQAITVSATEQIAIECSTLTTVDIPKMKDFALFYEEDNALFVSTLNNAYKTRGTAKSKESMHIPVTDFETGIPLPNTTISRKAPDGTIEKRITGPNGIGVYYSQATDSYDFLFQRPGYDDLNILNKGYVAGTLIKFDAVMTKTPPITLSKDSTPVAAKAKEEPKEEIKDVKDIDEATPNIITPAATKDAITKPPKA